MRSNLTGVNKFIKNLLEIIVLVLLLSQIIPQLDYYLRIVLIGYKTEIMILSLAGIIFLELIKNKFTMPARYFIGVGWIGYIGVIAFFSGNEFSKTILYNQILLFITVLLLFYLNNYVEVSTYRVMMKIILIAIIIVSITSIVGLKENSFAARELASGKIESFNVYSKLGIVGYNFVYGSVIIIPVLIGGALEKNFSIFIRGIFVVIITLIGILTFSASYTTAMLLYCAAVVVTLLVIIKNNWYKLMLSILLIVIMCIPGKSILLGNAILKVEPYIKNMPYVQFRMRDLGMSLKYKSVYGNMSNRTDTWQDSIEIIIENPVVGGALANNIQEVGGHSEVLDYLGNFGLIGMCIYISFIGVPLLDIFKMFKKIKMDRYLIVSIIFLFVESLINNTLRAPGLPIFIFIVLPGITILYNEKEKSYENIVGM